MTSQTRFFRHYKNKPYKYLGTARHSETLEELALYETLYENELGKIWVRPKDMFFEDVEINGVKRPRFEKIKFEFREAATVSEAALSDLQSVYEAAFGEKPDFDKIRSKLQAHTRILFQTVSEGKNIVGFKLGYAQDNDLFCSWLGAVRPEYQNLGVAGELMRLQHEWCRNNQFKKIETRTRNKYRSMIRLNLKHGFTIVGTQAGAGKGIKIILEKELL